MLQIKDLKKIYTTDGRLTEAFNDFNLEVKEGEFVVILGPSGCGKSTLLRMVAGLESITDGTIELDEKRVLTPGQERGMVFQSFTLFPWLTVYENIAFGLRLRKINESEVKRIVERYLEITGLMDFAQFYPKDLSGGMQQRVAIARTLANDPKVLLMDEPFGSLDSQTRGKMQEFLTQVWEKEKKTIIFITHDVTEAIFLADKVYVVSPRPMKIKKVHEIKFSRPRLHTLKHTEEFLKLSVEIADELEQSY